MRKFLKLDRYRFGIAGLLHCEARKPLCLLELQVLDFSHLRNLTPTLSW